MMYNGENLPYKVGIDEITFEEDKEGGYTGYLTDYPEIVVIGETKDEVLNNTNQLLTTLSILR